MYYIIQLEAIIGRANVPSEHRRAFLGQAAAAMLAALGLAVTRPESAARAGDPPDSPAQGNRPDLPEGGIRPTMPDKRPAPKPSTVEQRTVEQRVVAVIAKHLKLDAGALAPKEWLAVDLDATLAGQAEQRKALEKEFQIEIPAAAFKKLNTVGNAVDCVQKAVAKRDQERLKNPPAPDKAHPFQGSMRGIRPNSP